MWLCVGECLCVCVSRRRVINCLCTYRQQPEPWLTRWKICYDSFPENGKKKSEVPLRRGIPGTSTTSSLHRKMRECQWGLTLRHPTANQSIADITPRHVKPLQSRVLKFALPMRSCCSWVFPPPFSSSSPDNSCLPALLIFWRVIIQSHQNLNEPHFTSSK